MIASVAGVRVPIQLVMTVDPEAWAYVSGCPVEGVAGNIAAYLEAEVLELELVREAPVTGLEVTAGGGEGALVDKAQTNDEGEGQ